MPTITLKPLTENGSYLKGLPGLSSFTLSGNVHVVNDSDKKKPITIKTITVTFKGTSKSDIRFAGVDGVSYATNMTRKESDPISVVHVKEQKEIAVWKQLEPGQSLEFPFEILIPSPSEGGPTYLPHTTRIDTTYELETYYQLLTTVTYQKKNALGLSTTSESYYSDRIPFTSYDHRLLPVVYHLIGQDPSPSPGWVGGKAVNLPTTAKSNDTHGKWADVTFPEGLILQRNGPLLVNITSSPKVTTIKIKIKQYLSLYNRYVNHTTTILAPRTYYTDYKIFECVVLPSSTTETHTLNTWTTSPKQPAISTRPSQPGTKTPFKVTHTITVEQTSVTGSTLVTSAPFIIYDMGNGELGDLPKELVVEAASSMGEEDVEYFRQILDYPESPCRRLVKGVEGLPVYREE
ncbi:hypothetical protein HDV00_006468 [Rhizophlyctis rosea]|nr:hypothetical protein HDV00_006468 [Rhizophlyctis rosea]